MRGEFAEWLWAAAESSYTQIRGHPFLQELTGGQLDRVRDKFATAARYEWMFWAAAYRRERWPIPHTDIY